MIKFFKSNKPDIREEWNLKGEQFAKDINEMIAFGEKNGWENWKGEEPTDTREHLATEILQKLRAANSTNTVEQFRKDFPPSHSAIITLIEEKGQWIEQLHFITGEKIVFLTTTPYQKRQAYLLNNDQVITLDSTIHAIGKSKQNNIFAIAAGSKISTFKGWDGELLNLQLPGSEWDYTFSEKNGITTVSIAVYNESLERMERLIEMGFTEGFKMSMVNLENLLETLSVK